MTTWSTTLIAPVPFVGSAVEEVRAEHDWSAALGAPAHFTLLGPFLELGEVTGGVCRRLTELLQALGRLHLRLDELRLLGDVAVLVPDEQAALRAVARALHAEWPHLKPPGDLPHVTVGRGLAPATYERIAQRLGPELPAEGFLTEAVVLARTSCPERRVSSLQAARPVTRLARIPL